MKIKITPEARHLVSAIEQCCIQGNTDDAEIYAQQALNEAKNNALDSAADLMEEHDFIGMAKDIRNILIKR
jgi:hypothetical protein